MSNVDVNTNIDVWHCRLGRIPTSKLSLLHKIVPAITFSKQLHCTICPMAKQHRLPFSHSETKASKMFDPIHCDIWGPHSVSSLDGSKCFLTIVDGYSRMT